MFKESINPPLQLHGHKAAIRPLFLLFQLLSTKRMVYQNLLLLLQKNKFSVNPLGFKFI